MAFVAPPPMSITCRAAQSRPDLPIQFPSKFEMVVPLKPAKALGLTCRIWLLLGVDEATE
jgi:hypothetical protein